LITQDGRAPRLVMGRLGETISRFCQRYQIDVARRQVIINGMLSGQEVDPTVARIASDTEAVAVREPVEIERSSACVACGWCVDVCPAELTPVHLMQWAQKASEKAAGPALLRSAAVREALHCIGCGLCSYVCPTRLPLMQEILRLQEQVAAAERPEKTRGAA
jgi:Na+-translocating ferredoxin:NAD+ oxidoreductase subunit C